MDIIRRRKIAESFTSQYTRKTLPSLAPVEKVSSSEEVTSFKHNFLTLPLGENKYFCGTTVFPLT